MRPLLRDARDADAAGLIGLIGECWAEYPGCVLDVDGELPELHAIAGHFARRDGRFWVAEADGGLAGSVGALPGPGAAVELVKLYVAPSARRQGLGEALVRRVEEEARRRGARAVELWTDTRFTDAHRLYERLGYARQRGLRALDDLSRSVEHHYRKALDERAPPVSGAGRADR